MLKHIYLAALCLLTVFLFSCGNKNKQAGSVEANLPPGVAPNKAITGLTEQLKSDPDNHGLYYARAKELFQLGVYQSALYDIHKALGIDSSRAEYYILASDIYLTVNQTRKSKEYLEKCLSLDSKNKDANMKLAELYYYVTQYKKSIEYLDNVLRQDLHHPKAYFIKGMNFKEMKDTSKAISNFQTAIEQDPEYYNAYIQLANIFSRKGDPLSLEYLNTALKLNPQSTEALYAKGYFYQQKKDYESANKNYDLLLTIDPNHKNAYYNKGYIQMEQKKHTDALNYFTMAIQRDPEYKEAYYMRGLAYKQLGQKEKAREDFNAALKIDPDFTLAESQLK